MTLNLLILPAPYLLLQPLTLSTRHSLFLPYLLLFLPDLPHLRLQPRYQCLLVPELIPDLIALPPRCLEYITQTVRYPLTVLA
jgi:hypothetical protein